VTYHKRGGSGGGRRWGAEQTKNGLYTPEADTLAAHHPIRGAAGR